METNELIAALKSGRANPGQQREGGDLLERALAEVEALIQKLDQSKAMNKSLMEKAHGKR